VRVTLQQNLTGTQVRFCDISTNRTNRIYFCTFELQIVMLLEKHISNGGVPVFVTHRSRGIDPISINNENL
jgi:hypothetical protein